MILIGSTSLLRLVPEVLHVCTHHGSELSNIACRAMLLVQDIQELGRHGIAVKQALYRNLLWDSLRMVFDRAQEIA